MYAKPTVPRSIGEILDGSFRLTASAFKSTWYLALLAGLASYVSSAYQFTSGVDIDDPLAIYQDPIFLILYALGSAVGLLFVAAIYLQIDAIAAGREGADNPFGIALSRLPMLIVMLILYTLAIVLGIVLLIVPGIILMVTLLLSTAVLLLEQKGPIDALRISHSLVWGHWWWTSAILTVGVVILLVFYVVAGLLGTAIVALVGGDALIAGITSMFVVMALVSAVSLPYFTALMLNIYWDLKLRREGTDLAARARAI